MCSLDEDRRSAPPASLGAAQTIAFDRLRCIVYDPSATSSLFLPLRREWSGGGGRHYEAGSCPLRKTSLALNLNCPGVWHFNPSKSFLLKWAGCRRSLVSDKRVSSAERRCQSKCSGVQVWKVGAVLFGCSGLMRDVAFGLQVLSFHTDFLLVNWPTPFCIFILFWWVRVLEAMMLCFCQPHGFMESNRD